MSNAVVRPSMEELIPVYQELLPRQKIKALAKVSGVTLYWRLFSPLIVLWGFIYQRFDTDHTCDGFVSHLYTGGADNLDPDDSHISPLSKRLKSENSSGYCQGRIRLPLSIIQGCLSYTAKKIASWLPSREAEGDQERGRWKGFVVRLLDGTTFRLRPLGNLVESYGQACNQHGASYWVVVRSMVAFCLYSQSVVSYAEGRTTISEQAMVKQLMEADPEENSLYVGDQGLGVYQVVQIAHHFSKKVVLRVTRSVAQSLQKRNSSARYLKPGEERTVFWSPQRRNKLEPGLPVLPIEGRIIYARIETPGFRPMDIYLFTTLLDQELYSATEIVELYGQRLRVEIDYRHIKTTLEMEQFEVKSAEMFRKELAAGLLTYNLICGLMVKAAQIGQLLPSQLSFARCWRRIRHTLFQGVPVWVYEQGDVQNYLLKRLAKCIIPHQPNKVRHEPRKVRRRPAPFPPLIGDRNKARQEILDQFLEQAKT